MTQWGKLLNLKPDDLSSVLVAHRVDEETDFYNLSCGTHAPTHTQSHNPVNRNKCNKMELEFIIGTIYPL